ncbi:MAG TPA: sensor histidine kinase [Ktedonobacterales bacterium]
MRLDVVSDAPPEPQHEGLLDEQKPVTGKGQALAILLMALVIGVLAAWALLTFQLPSAPYGMRSVVLFPLLILLVDLGARLSAFQSLWRAYGGGNAEARKAIGKRVLALPQVTLPLYLACAILLGLQTAVLAALLIEGILQALVVALRPRNAWQAMYRVTANGLLVLAGGGCYRLLVDIFASGGQHIDFEVRLGVDAAGALVMLLLWPLVILPLEDDGVRHLSLRTWFQYFRTSEARFQLLLLSIGPLLPLVEGLDDLEAELAWLLFLVPLFVIYYLALVSLRFQHQTEELQASLQALRKARRRQAELQDYAALVTRAQEDERRRLARELHDDTAQALIALSRGLEALTGARDAGRALADEARWVEDLRELADRSLESVRRACRDLRPSVLDDLGLAAGLDWLVEGTVQRGLPCALQIEGERQTLPGEAELVFFRIAQEALANAWKHARASQAEVILAYMPGLARLCVKDNGCGFDLAEVEQRHVGGGLGLLGMRERAALISAELEILSAPGQGTKVDVRLALPTSAE